MPYKKAIAKPDLGVDLSVHSYEISPRAWTVMSQMRARLGRITNFPGWTSILAPLAPRLEGATGTLIAHFKQFDDTTFLLVGDATKLYRYVPGTQSLADISGTTYGPTPDNPWCGFFAFNSYYVTNLIDGLHKFTGVGNFVNLSGAPRARSGLTLNDYVLLFNTVDDDGEHHQRIQWAAEGTDDDWVATPTNDAGRFDFLSLSDQGLAIQKIGNDAVLYFERSIIPLTFIGGNEVFGARQIIEKIGLIGQDAIVNLGDRHIFMGNEFFCEYVGGASINREIGNKVRDSVYSNLHPVFKNRTKSMHLPDTNEIMFFYPSSNSIGECDTCVIYNTVDTSWYGPFPITVSAVGTTQRGITKVINQDNEIINLDNTLINLNLDLQSSPLTLFVDNTGDIQSIGEGQSANGAPLTRVLESGDHFLGNDLQAMSGAPVTPSPDTVFLVNAVNIQVENITQNEPIQMFLGVRMDLMNDIVYKGPFTVNSYKTQRSRIPVRGTGRWFRVRFVIPNNARLSLLGYQYECEIVGVR